MHRAGTAPNVHAATMPQRSGSSTDAFAFSPSQLQALLHAKACDFHAIGGLHGLCAGLRTDAKAGIDIDETIPDGTAASYDSSSMGRPGLPRVRSTVPHATPYSLSTGLLPERRRIFGSNRLPKPHQRTFGELMWMAFNTKLMFLLVASALASLLFATSHTVILGNSKSSNTGWVESATIISAIFATVMATAANDYQKNYRFQKLNERKEERWVTAIRAGKNCRVSVFDIVVGDIVRVEAGDIPSADGVMIEAFQIRCNESHLFGESDFVHKIPAEQYSGDAVATPFIFSGSIVSQGVGTYLVIAVGTNATAGRTAISLRSKPARTPLEQKVGSLAHYIIVVSSIGGVIYFLVLLTRWAIQLDTARFSSPVAKGESFLNIFMLAVTVVVVGVPEGLSLAVAIALAYATTHMLKQNSLVRLLRSCEVMGNATTICFDKTGTLTMNEMSVVSGIIGCNEHFASYDPTPPAAKSDHREHGGVGKVIPTTKLRGELARDVKSLLRSSIVLNSTVFERNEMGSNAYVGSSTETALLNFATEHLDVISLADERSSAHLMEMFPFDGTRKYMATIIRRATGYRLIVKGAAEIIIDHCAETLEATKKAWNPREVLIAAPLGPEARQELRGLAQRSAQRRLRTVALAYRDLDSWPPIAALGAQDDRNDSRANFEQVFHHQLTFVAMFALRDPVRPNAVDTIRRCQQAGVFVRMLTGDHLTTAEAIARETGIYTAGGIAMDGPTFRRLSPTQLNAVIPKLQVLARANEADKAQLVRSLQNLGETVAVTGDGTNDAYAIKTADVGFAMGIAGTDVAKQASSIVLIDDNFASVVNSLMWGRAVTDGVKKYCQFQFALNLTAVVITVISTLIGDVSSSVFDVTQLLWLNLVMDIITAISFSTDMPLPYLIRRRPEPRNAPLITIAMWKMIIAQSIYQLAVTFTLHYAGPSRFWADVSKTQAQTVVFNTFMFMQLFNQINCRRVDNGLDVITGILGNPWFLAVQALTFTGQIIIVLAGGETFGTEPLTGAQWGWSVIFGLFVIPIGAVTRCIPDDWVVATGHSLKPLALLFRQARNFSRIRQLGRSSQRQDRADSIEHVAEQGHAGHGWAAAMQPVTVVTASVRDASNPAHDGDRMNNESTLDLFAAVEASKNHDVDGAVPGLRVHSETERCDPVLVAPALSLECARQKIPPSQNRDLMRYVGTHRKRERRGTDT